jgi:hypothetical protein
MIRKNRLILQGLNNVKLSWVVAVVEEELVSDSCVEEGAVEKFSDDLVVIVAIVVGVVGVVIMVVAVDCTRYCDALTNPYTVSVRQVTNNSSTKRYSLKKNNNLGKDVQPDMVLIVSRFSVKGVGGGQSSKAQFLDIYDLLLLYRQ